MIDLDATFTRFPRLETERLVLREFAPADVDAMFAIMSDARVLRYFGSLPMTTRDDALRRVEGIRSAFRKREGVRWAVERRIDGQLIGSCGFWRLLPEHARAEVGYELSPDTWGQGVMTEALRAVLAFGFSTMRLHSVEAQIHPANIGSQRVLEKLGFVREGYFRENYFDPIEQRFTDTAVYSLRA
jgi:ribosomal-protein-alanine N-acetyltransferase